MGIIRKLLLSLLILLSSFLFKNSLYSIDLDNIIAYPVPFNLNSHVYLTVGYGQGITNNEADRITLEIFDINGDRVFSRNFTSLNVIWNGRNRKGSKVRPGLYIIKISLENLQTGDYGQKTIRILICK